MHRVQKLLSNYGHCSRRKGEDLIAAGRVRVNGKLITLGDKAGENDTITVDNKVIKAKRRIYLMFNKPIGCVTAMTDKYEKTVMDYIKIKERVIPVGRLDKNTTGLLLLTNDGDFANQIMHPSHEINKTYVVETNKPVLKSYADKMEAGIMLDDGRTSPSKVVRLGPAIIQITIHEGKNRVVRRMFEKLGFRIKKLSRIRIGRLRLDDMKSGHYRTLNRKDIDKIFVKK